MECIHGDGTGLGIGASLAQFGNPEQWFVLSCGRGIITPAAFYENTKTIRFLHGAGMGYGLSTGNGSGYGTEGRQPQAESVGMDIVLDEIMALFQ